MLGEDPLLSWGVPLAHIHVESIFKSVQTVSCDHMLQLVGLQERGYQRGRRRAGRGGSCHYITVS